jgi:hypothetical protein
MKSVSRTRLRIWGSGVRISSGAPSLRFGHTSTHASLDAPAEDERNEGSEKQIPAETTTTSTPYHRVRISWRKSETLATVTLGSRLDKIKVGTSSLNVARRCARSSKVGPLVTGPTGTRPYVAPLSLKIARSDATVNQPPHPGSLLSDTARKGEGTPGNRAEALTDYSGFYNAYDAIKGSNQTTIWGSGVRISWTRRFGTRDCVCLSCVWTNCCAVLGSVGASYDTGRRRVVKTGRALDATSDRASVLRVA